MVSQYRSFQSAHQANFENKPSSPDNLNVSAATARSLPTQIVRKPCRGYKDAGGAEEGLAGIAVPGVHGQGVAGHSRDVEIRDAGGVALAGVAAVVGIAETDEVGVETLTVVDHRFGGVGAYVGRVGSAGAGQSGAGGDDRCSGLVTKGSADDSAGPEETGACAGDSRGREGCDSRWKAEFFKSATIGIDRSSGGYCRCNDTNKRMICSSLASQFLKGAGFAYAGAGVTPAAGTVTVVVGLKKIKEGHKLAASADWELSARRTLSALHGACRFSSFTRPLTLTTTLNARKRMPKKKFEDCMMDKLRDVLDTLRYAKVTRKQGTGHHYIPKGPKGNLLTEI
ncbi:hypothetical protein MMC07_006542 [Pseudocyphellaria aurata]|nr:hypothetical protein [Pseudocyphellaria aurata]